MIIKYLSPAGVSSLIAKIKANFAAQNHGHNLPDLDGTLPIAKGGTGANTAANALNALGGMPKSGGAFTGNVNFNEGNVSKKRVMVDKGDGLSATMSTGSEPKMASVYLSVGGQWTNAITLYEDKTTLTKPLDVASGGTGAQTAEQARKNLGIQGNGVVWEKGRLASAGSGENNIKFSSTHSEAPTTVLAYQNSGSSMAGYKITNVSNTGFTLTSQYNGIAWVWVALWL